MRVCAQEGRKEIQPADSNEEITNRIAVKERKNQTHTNGERKAAAQSYTMPHYAALSYP